MAADPRIRKSLLTQHYDNTFPSHCYMCYICAEDCYIRSAPSVSPPLPHPAAASHGPHLSSLLLLMLGLLAVAFFVLSYFTIRRYRSSLLNSGDLEIGDFFLFRDWSQQQGRGLDYHDHNHNHVWYIRAAGLSQASIDSLPVFDFKKHVKGSKVVNDCAVCLGEFLEDEKVRLLPKCGHPFHLPCIDPWLRLHTSCPVCRAPVTVESEENLARNGSVVSGEEIRGRDGPETRVRIEIEESREASSNGGVLGNRSRSLRAISDLAERWAKFRQDSRAGRRTMSMDLSAEFMMLERVEKPNRSKKSCKNSPGRFLQKGAVAMKRSLSYSGKRLARKSGNSRSRGSTSSSALGC